MSTKHTKIALRCGIAAYALIAAAAPAFAQDPNAGGSSTPTATNTGRGTEVENPGDIIVTARRTEERLQDVPISITVFNNQQIVDKNIAIASDLPAYTPSLSVNTRFGPEKASFAIRGFNQDASTGPTVGVYFADVISLRAQGGTTGGNTAAAGAFTDLQNVQVLKGPQGTLFGRNTTGGAILLVPQRPTDRLEGYIEGTYGNYDQKRIQAALNIPLADTFKVRFSLDRNERDGYMKNHSGIGPRDYNDTDYWYGRLSILAELTPDLENYTVAYYSHSDTNGYASRLAVCNNNPADPLFGARARQNLGPAFIGGRTPNTTLATTGAACDQLARQNARGDSLTDVDVYQPDASSGVILDQWQVINTTTWKASDNLTIKNIASFGEYREKSAFNLDSDNFRLPAEFGPLAGQRFQYIALDTQPGYDAASQSTTTEELQLQGSALNNKLTYVVGGYLEFSRPISFNQQRTGIFGNCLDAGTLNCAAPLGFVSVSQSRTRFSFDNHGVFAQATYNFSDKLAVTGGIRETFDKTVGFSQSSRYTLLSNGAGGSFPFSQSCNDSFRHPGVNALTNPLGLEACNTTISQSTKKPTWLIDLDFKPNSDILIYGKYARGYRQGGINFTNPGLETFGPEKVDLYEVGLKTSFRGALTGYFNVAAFYNDFSNQQVFAQAIPSAAFAGLVSGGNVVINAGKSVLKGVEVDSSVALLRDFRVDLGYTYLDTKLKSIPSSADLQPRTVGTPFGQLIPVSVVGEPLTFTPKHRVVLTGTYTLPVDERIGKVSFSATYLYTASQLAASLTVTPIGRLPATNLLNLNLNWNNVLNSGFDVAGFATNVTNRKYPVSTAGGYTSGGFDAYIVGVPRIYGVRLRYHFGN
jgi:iron complex outermembrane receptor protein